MERENKKKVIEYGDKNMVIITQNVISMMITLVLEK